jgi:hypothetical protein
MKRALIDCFCVIAAWPASAQSNQERYMLAGAATTSKVSDCAVEAT